MSTLSKKAFYFGDSLTIFIFWCISYKIYLLFKKSARNPAYKTLFEVKSNVFDVHGKVKKVRTLF